MKTYAINEIFYSLQGEGVRAGEPSVFVRFAGCNLKCAAQPSRLSPGGWECDTDHSLRCKLTAEQIVAECERVGGPCDWVVLTGGEPALQLDSGLVRALRCRYRVAIETNGTLPLPDGIDWIALSPKDTNLSLAVHSADEVKCVLAPGQPLPTTHVRTKHKLLSPAFRGVELNEAALHWCISLVLQHPEWRLSVQQHKLWGVR